MRMVGITAALFVVVGGGAGYALIGGNSAPQKILAVVEVPEIPKFEKARLAHLIAPSSDGITKTVGSPIPPIKVPTKSTPKTKRVVVDKKIKSDSHLSKAKAG
jgi:hypothetical protein